MQRRLEFQRDGNATYSGFSNTRRFLVEDKIKTSELNSAQRRLLSVGGRSYACVCLRVSVCVPIVCNNVAQSFFYITQCKSCSFFVPNATTVKLR